MLKVELHTHEIPDIFANFKNIVGEEHWLRRVKLIKQSIKGHIYLKDHFHKENSIAFALSKYSACIKKYGGIPLQEIENRELYPAISFAAQTLSIIEHASNQQKKALTRRIHGAFKNPGDMRAIQLEMLAATHFVRQGYPISWPEMDETGNFDLLVNDIGSNGLEVECKSISRDKGKKIHQFEIHEFYNLIAKEIKPIIRDLEVGLSVVLTVPERLPSQHSKRKALANRIGNQILAAHSKSFEDGCDIRITEFDFYSNFDNVSSAHGAIDIDMIDQITETKNRGAAVIGNHCGGGVIFVVQSRQDDTLLDSIFNTLNRSAKNQLNKTRPALFLVGFHDLEINALYEIAQHDADSQNPPTPLRIGVSNFLSSKNRDHIVSISFIGDELLTTKKNGDLTSGGASYTFTKEESIFWHKDFIKILQ
ncbi:MAG: hypothetical protein KAS48_08625 [Gammaproteobacteria bacterium]|nr:hypothetical protein [Gammaproteobacteria bacterium]